MSKSKLKTLALTLTLVTTTEAAAESFDSDAAWNLLNTATVREKIENDRWEAIKVFPDALRAATRNFEVQGYVVPVLPEARMSQFILVQDPENCPFCGNGAGYGPVLEVMMDKPIPSVPEFSQLKVAGTLELIDDPETFQMFRLTGARTLD